MITVKISDFRTRSTACKKPCWQPMPATFKRPNLQVNNPRMALQLHLNGYIPVRCLIWGASCGGVIAYSKGVSTNLGRVSQNSGRTEPYLCSVTGSNFFWMYKGTFVVKA